ncbi:aryl-sulfate sulfotransferase [Formosa undariae]|uniref:Aryl-sulfate sulfotransferase n=1 Tax=Formosa undariae TaxID=1325436 RepID=A0ABV5EY99_9FLAO
MQKLKYIMIAFGALILFSQCSDDAITDETDGTDVVDSGTIINADYTVGLTYKTDEASEGYTLFAPIGSTTTYLIDNCGDEVYSWPSNYMPSHSVYLLENGYLLRTGNASNSSFNAGGQGGIIEMINPDGDVVWDYTVSSSTELQHHDVEYLDNGNILIIAWDKKTGTEATAAGLTTSLSELWSEKIIEIQPNIEAGTAVIVWEWNAWDHIVQDQSEGLSNFGVVSEHPELLNINYDYESDEIEDWLHFNSIDYNETLDQILVSSRSYSEFYIIDHSTSTDEAASHTGGTHGKGGDILYRWGNSQTYDQGSSSDQQLYNQHDAHWIESGFLDGDMIMVFNNRAGDAVGSNYSAVNVINPDVNADGSYDLTDDVFGPIDFHWTYTADTPTDLYSAFISGATRLENGNTLICEGSTGIFTEVNYSGETVWEYINPVSGSGIADQYDNAGENRLFRAERYTYDFAGFSDYDLYPLGTLESGSDYACE